MGSGVGVGVGVFCLFYILEVGVILRVGELLLFWLSKK